MRKVISKRGQTASAIRSLLSVASAAKNGNRSLLEILDLTEVILAR